MLLGSGKTFWGEKSSDLACTYAGLGHIIGGVFANCFQTIAILR